MMDSFFKLSELPKEFEFVEIVKEYDPKMRASAFMTLLENLAAGNVTATQDEAYGDITCKTENS